MPKEQSETENQMALFGLPEKPKAVAGKPRTKPVAQPEATAAPAPKAIPAKKKTPPPKAAAPVPPPRRGSGLVPEGDIRLTANIREDLHLRLKIAAAKQRTTIGEIIEELVEKYV
jgi:hypothetical protein